MAYTSGIYFIDLESGSDAARTALTTVTVSNPSGTITRLNKTAHGLVTGAVVDLTAFTAWLNAAWKITVVDADNFDLDAAVWQTTGDASGTATPRGGSSKADAWKTFEFGATAARIAPGDMNRVIASPEPTLVGDVAWTQYSKTLTLPDAVTANICDCEVQWTGSANVTQTADTAQFKENTKSAKSVIAAGFTTGKVAYFATGTLDLSAYQQVSFWVRNTVATTAGMLELRLCSDTIGDTVLHTIAIPALPSINNWVPLAIDLAANLNSAVASIALYAVTDPGSNTINIDSIIACKASSSADALTLTSLIGKVHNFSWVASTTYAANTIRRPTQPNRNGYCYKVTAGGGGAAGSSEPTWPQALGLTVTDGALTWTCLDLEDTWYAIQSINGTTVKVDSSVNALGNQGRGHDSTTETVATYKREASKITMTTNSGYNGGNVVKDTGTAVSLISYVGGWDRTSMSSQSGETWCDAQNQMGSVIATYAGGNGYVHIENINGVRHWYGLALYGVNGFRVRNMHCVSCGYGAYVQNTSLLLDIQGMVLSASGAYGWYSNIDTSGVISRLRSSNNLDTGIFISSGTYNASKLHFRDPAVNNNGSYSFRSQAPSNPDFSNMVTDNNASYIYVLTGDLHLNNCLISETTEFSGQYALYDSYIYSQRHDQTADNHLITTDGGTIVSATDQRHTASGISWKFRPTSTNRSSLYPLKLSVAKIAVSANVAVNINIWTSRDNANIKGQLCILGGQIAGVPNDVMVACEPSINTWTQSDALTFTPTETGVVEICFKCWDGVGTTNSLWCDDITVA